MTLNSISILVEDIDRMTLFYEQAFGIAFKEVITRERPAMFGTLPSGVTLKLILSEERVAARSLHSLGMAVPDVDGVIELAVELGGELVGEVLRNGDLAYATIRDPDGNMLELYTG